MSDRKAVIKNADMSEEMQQDAVECATQALEKYNIEKDIAAYIKKVTPPPPLPQHNFKQQYY